jgi:peptide/nickel transport system substrate-binding protein
MNPPSSRPASLGKYLRGLTPLLTLVLVACSTPAQPGQQGASEPAQPARRETTLRISSRFEPQSLAAKYQETGGVVAYKGLMNAGLTAVDYQNQGRPILAERLPELNTESWRVFADGRMETTYQLRAGLTWHDGQPLTADDFAFAFRVYTAPGLPFSAKPQDQIEAVTAPDPRTVVVSWRSPYVDAALLRATDLSPLPARILEESFTSTQQDGATDRFLNHPYWSYEFVGTGPYRLERWDPGSMIQGVAFDGYILGRPQIDRVVIRAMGDETVVLTNLLAGDLHYTPKLTLRFEHAALLDESWVPSGRGKYLVGPDQFWMNIFQLRPEFLQEPALLDVRVRRALSYSLDRQGLADGLFNGAVPPSETLLYKWTPYFAEADRVLTHYPYDPRRAQQLLEEAGLTRGSDGFYANPGGRRFEPDYQVRAGTQAERGQAIQIDTWRRAGIYAVSSVLPNVTVPAIERHNVPGFQLRVANQENWELFMGSEIGAPENRWTGINRTGWAHPEYDRLVAAYRNSIDRREMDRLSVQILKVLSDELPGFVAYESPSLMAMAGNLTGPEFGGPGTPGRPPTTEFWDVERWQFSGSP